MKVPVRIGQNSLIANPYILMRAPKSIAIEAIRRTWLVGNFLNAQMATNEKGIAHSAILIAPRLTQMVLLRPKALVSSIAAGDIVTTSRLDVAR